MANDDSGVEPFLEIGDDHAESTTPQPTPATDEPPKPKRTRPAKPKQDEPQVEAEATAPPMATDSEVDFFTEEQVRVEPSRDSKAEKQLRIVPARKPRKTEWVRVHPDPVAFVRDTYVLKPDEQSGGSGDELYYVPGSVREAIGDEHTLLCRVHLAVNRQGDYFLWWVRIYDDGSGPGVSWSQSALDAIGDARSRWVRVSANKSQGAYDLFFLKDGVTIPEPKWPEDKTMMDLLRLAFRNKIIATADHVLIKHLDGRA